MDNFKKLLVWQKADELAFIIYTLTASFPKDENFGVTSQLRRAVLSVPLNIVEGHSRGRKAEFVHFLNIAMGSLSEVNYLVDFSKRLGYIKSEENNLSQLISEVSRLLWSFKKAVKK